MPSDAENVSHLTLSALQAVKSPKDLRSIANAGGREQYDCSGNRQSLRDRDSEMGVNPASWRVLEKCGFAREGVLQRHSEFPNLKADDPFRQN